MDEGEKVMVRLLRHCGTTWPVIECPVELQTKVKRRFAILQSQRRPLIDDADIKVIKDGGYKTLC